MITQILRQENPNGLSLQNEGDHTKIKTNLVIQHFYLKKTLRPTPIMLYTMSRDQSF